MYLSQLFWKITWKKKISMCKWSHWSFFLWLIGNQISSGSSGSSSTQYILHYPRPNVQCLLGLWSKLAGKKKYLKDMPCTSTVSQILERHTMCLSCTSIATTSIYKPDFLGSLTIQPTGPSADINISFLDKTGKKRPAQTSLLHNSEVSFSLTQIFIF